MCDKSCIDFANNHLKSADIQGKSVIEVGAYDINGSLRSMVENFQPSSYKGVDIAMGPGVDEVCNAEDLVSHYGSGQFDLLICTEVVEHVQNWRSVFSNLKQIVKPGGVLLLTTRSKGFPFHSAPADYWRYQVSDMEVIFSDFSIEVLEKDPDQPGVFVKARKPDNFDEKDLTDYQLYSIVKHKRLIDIDDADINQLDRSWNEIELVIRRNLSVLLPYSLKKFIKKNILRIL
ncbi:class I SAM-dependent methyltransferase [Roseofilum casamattae]|uniref:Class I SAM-dependent methyltransferase n=1 Tax=Roseofilum casamattae BLCC-M143 TaxID=3022442 RepID=A0ABT7C0U1_9CYAN|nr:class I SAM-dependent methyltransferase [Roseofilum casamattae]MDJ1185070.1 class I SAM-dependent methyltransferase [Roseofilum casamattae BLCC-M143]